MHLCVVFRPCAEQWNPNSEFDASIFIIICCLIVRIGFPFHSRIVLIHQRISALHAVGMETDA